MQPSHTPLSHIQAPRFRPILWLTALNLLLVSAASQATTFGIGWHDQDEDPQEMVRVMRTNGLTHLRLDISKKQNLHDTDPDFVRGSSAPTKRLIDVVKTLKSNGITTTAIISTELAYRVKTGQNLDAAVGGTPKLNYNTNCPGDQADVEKNVYNDAKAQIEGLAEWVTDFEMENEVNLYKDIRHPQANAPYLTPDVYDTECGRTMAAALRGIAAAMNDVKKATGKPLRTILGTTDNGISGFLIYMLNKKVSFDVVGYHTYLFVNTRDVNTDPWFNLGEKQDPNKTATAYWQTGGGPMGLLKKFNRPVHINEFNCAEIYGKNKELPYINRNGSESMNVCGQSIKKHLAELKKQQSMIQFITLFELRDRLLPNVCEPSRTADPDSPKYDPGLPGAECRFGFFFNDGTPALNKPKQILKDATQFPDDSYVPPPTSWKDKIRDLMVSLMH